MAEWLRRRVQAKNRGGAIRARSNRALINIEISFFLDGGSTIDLLIENLWYSKEGCSSFCLMQ
jgi:hypothetical protein